MSSARAIEKRSVAERFDVSGAAAIVVGALSASLLVIVVALTLNAGDGPMLADLADKLVTGLLGMLAATRLNRPNSSEPQPVTLADQPVRTHEVGGARTGPATADTSHSPI